MKPSFLETKCNINSNISLLFVNSQIVLRFSTPVSFDLINSVTRQFILHWTTGYPSLSFNLQGIQETPTISEVSEHNVSMCIVQSHSRVK